MVGVFDSGSGGLTAISEIRRLAPNTDICFLADRKNAPYGTKSNGEIVAAATKSIRRLLSLGAERVLIACCTASSLHHLLPEEERRVSVPIVEACSLAACASSKAGRIGVLATEATVRSGAFKKRIRAILPEARVCEISASELVTLTERGARDGGLGESERERIFQILLPLMRDRIDTLVLGCTHFPHLINTFSGLMPGVKIISSAHEGARLGAEIAALENGKTVYTD